MVAGGQKNGNRGGGCAVYHRKLEVGVFFSLPKTGAPTFRTGAPLFCSKRFIGWDERAKNASGLVWKCTSS
jgi:hypothetical protein